MKNDKFSRILRNDKWFNVLKFCNKTKWLLNYGENIKNFGLSMG